MCGAEEQSQRVRSHEGVIGSRKSQWTPDFSQNSGTYIVYNSYMTCSNSSFSLVIVTPTFHFFVFPLVSVHVHVLLVPHWLLAQAHFYGRTYLPPFAEFNHVHRSRWYSDNHLCWYYLRPGEAVNNIRRYNNTCRIRWHSGNHFVDIIFAGWNCQQHPSCNKTCKTWGHSRNHFVDIIFADCSCQQHPP